MTFNEIDKVAIKILNDSLKFPKELKFITLGADGSIVHMDNRIKVGDVVLVYDAPKHKFYLRETIDYFGDLQEGEEFED